MKNLLEKNNWQKPMNKIQLNLFLIAVLIFCSATIFSQSHNHEHMQRCHTDETYQEMILTHPEYAKNRKIIEREMQAIINNPNREQNLNGIITIPVVYHIIHDGDAVGTNENLSVALLQAQLDQMTDDFRRLNSDANNTPADFTGVAADSEIEFCLTTIDPAGLATTGIERHHINTFVAVNLADCWTSGYINSKMKPSTIWDRDKYLNIWTVVKINRTSDCANTILGYAQFPGGPVNTDGIVLRANTVGSIATPNPSGGNFDQGRTGTHEVGHYLNLRHIWGDGGCSVDDLVADTPTAGADNNTGAPCTYPGPNSCNDGVGDLPDMFQNYMDYSVDQCMNLFTAGQKTRMHAAITASRPTLITTACGATPANDLQANAISIDCNTALYSGTTVNATSSDFPDLGTTCGTTITAPGVWYKMTGMHADVTLDLCQAPYDSKMNIYEDDGNGGLICINGEDDDDTNCGGNFNDPYIMFASEIGKTYYIYIQGFSGQTGTFDLNVSCDCYTEVVNTMDSGLGSLREVIACASDGGTITFDPAIDGQNIMLSSGQIVINKDLTIIGNGMNNTIIDAALDDVNRIFDIPTGGAAGSLAIHIEGLTIQNGGSLTASSIEGAAISNHQLLSMLDVKIKNNKVTGSRISGIMNWTGSFTAVNCIFEGNIADNPSSGKGTIWAQGNSIVSINQCLFTGNSGDNLLYGISTSFFELLNNTTYNNTMNNHIFAVEVGEVHIDNNIISEGGSAQYLGGGITTSTITNNLSGAADPDLLASDGNIVGDPLFVDAVGGDFNLQNNSPAINQGDNVQIAADIFDLDGDANTTEDIPFDFEGNTRIAGCGSNVDLGAFENDASNPGLVVTNTNDNGGGSLRHVIACSADGDIITFDAGIDGQNIMLTSGEITIDKNLTILGNGMDDTIIDGALDDLNRIFDIPSGGTHTIRIQNLTIQNGGSATANVDGAAIQNRQNLELLDVKFKGNRTTGFNKSVLMIWEGNASIVNCVFDDNTNSSATSNSATIYAQASSSLTIHQSIFTNNIDLQLVYSFTFSDGALNLSNNTTYNNTISSQVFIKQDGEVHFNNNIISENGDALRLVGTIEPGSTITNNLSGAADPDLLASDGNIVGDPLFMDAAAGDFNLALGSPCFNTGNPAHVPLDIFDIDDDNNTTEPIPTDLTGNNSRVISGQVDMGAFERIPDVCEDTYPIVCGETLTEDITGYIVNLGCGVTYTSKIHEFTAANDGTVTIDFTNYTGNKFIYLYDDLCGSNCTELASSFSGSTTEQIIYSVTNGTTYYIEVYDEFVTGGSYDLSLSCIDCSSDLVFTSPTDDISSGVENHSTDENITSDIVISGAGTDVTYSAGNATGKSINLNSGFCVESGAAFEANLDGCVTAPPFAPNDPNKEQQLSKRTDRSKRKARN